jgi:hypothetical protein
MSTNEKGNNLKVILARIREGLTEGIRREVERCRKLGIPLCVARNGKVEAIMPEDSAPER